MKIGLEVGTARPGMTGVGTYASLLAEALGRHRGAPAFWARDVDRTAARVHADAHLAHF